MTKQDKIKLLEAATKAAMKKAAAKGRPVSGIAIQFLIKRSVILRP